MSYTAALPRAVLGGVHGRNEAHLQLSTDENWQGSGCCLYLPCVNMCLVAGQAGGPISILQTRLCSPQIGEHGSLHPGLCPLPCSHALLPQLEAMGEMETSQCSQEEHGALGLCCAPGDCH